MAATVAIYYWWPAGTAVLTHVAAWQRAGGIIGGALAMSLAGGVLSELSLIYFQDKGRWTAAHLDNMAFKIVFFLINGAIVYEFYLWQTFWFGEGPSWSILLPKLVVDQFIYSVIWSLPVQTLSFRWHHLGYSASRLRQELGLDFVVERMLPVLVTNWMFWIPGVLFIYSMPTVLQMPLAIFATAIWSVLLSAVSKHDGNEKSKPTLLTGVPEIAAQTVE